MIPELMRSGSNGRGSVVLALGLLCAAPAPASAEERPRLVQLNGGIFNVGKSSTQGEVGIELSRPIRWWRLDLAGGVSATEEGSIWGYLGVRRDLAPGERWGVAPGWGVALYEAGDGKELGGSIQFRSSLAIDYRITRRSRLGVTLYHLSNAGLEHPNPGSNSAVLTYGIELR